MLNDFTKFITEYCSQIFTKVSTQIPKKMLQSIINIYNKIDIYSYDLNQGSPTTGPQTGTDP